MRGPVQGSDGGIDYARGRVNACRCPTCRPRGRSAMDADLQSTGRCRREVILVRFAASFLRPLLGPILGPRLGLLIIFIFGTNFEGPKTDPFFGPKIGPLFMQKLGPFLCKNGAVFWANLACLANWCLPNLQLSPRIRAPRRTIRHRSSLARRKLEHEASWPCEGAVMLLHDLSSRWLCIMRIS